jgi:hypothetical protein
VPSGITLVLEQGIVMDGSKKNAPLVSVNGGTLVMRAGSTLRNAADSGVFVGGGRFTMSGRTISGNTASDCGGGVWGDGSGRFVKRGGGTINATNTAPNGGVAFVSDDRFVWVDKRRRNSAAGPGVNLDSSVSSSAGGLE